MEFEDPLAQSFVKARFDTAIENCISDRLASEQGVQILGFPGLGVKFPQGSGNGQPGSDALETLPIRDDQFDSLAGRIRMFA